LVAKGKETTAVKVVTLSRLEYYHFKLFLLLKEHLAGQIFYEDEDVNKKKRRQRLVVFTGGGGLWQRNKKLCTQAKQMPSKKCWLCRKIPKIMCSDFFHSLVINYF